MHTLGHQYDASCYVAVKKIKKKSLLLNINDNMLKLLLVTTITVCSSWFNEILHRVRTGQVHTLGH